MTEINLDNKIKLHELATAQIAQALRTKIDLGEETQEEEYLKFYEKIFNKLKALTEAE
ncbi:MAG: hypothetical protein NOU37_07050 [Candidatus Brocadiales bacterium]|nr:hypothetical protein [Candidatus Bathyanammoxibius amoris]